MKYITIVLGAAALVLLIIFYQAWVLTLGWGWFIVPLGAPAIGYAHALGLSMLIHMVTYQTPPKETKEGWEAVGTGVLRITFILLLMWIYSLFMP